MSKERNELLNNPLINVFKTLTDSTPIDSVEFTRESTAMYDDCGMYIETGSKGFIGGMKFFNHALNKSEMNWLETKGNPEDTFFLSACFKRPYEYTETIKPKWWQLWKKPVVNIIASERWERSNTMLYRWQFNALGFNPDDGIDFDDPKMATLLHIMGNGYTGEIIMIQLESDFCASQYIKTGNDNEQTNKKD